MIDLTRSVVKWPFHILLRRFVWSYVLEPLVRWLPKPFSFIRVLVLRLMGARIGRQCLIMPGVKVLMPWNLFLSDCVALGADVFVYNFAPVIIGRMTVISQGVFLCTGSHDYTLSNMPLIYKKIVISSECWVAADCFIMPGVYIATGVVVGARSVVTKSITCAWSVFAGNPCVFLKSRIIAD